MPRKLKTQLPALHLGSETIGQRIARIRKKRGLTQAQLGKKIGITQNLVSDYETGTVRLFDEMVARFALALKVSTDEILGLRSSSHIEPPTTLRVMKRVQQLEKLPALRKKLVLRMLDDLIRASSTRSA
jgi:transcriptional regulator with XRE-family HTH domain